MKLEQIRGRYEDGLDLDLYDKWYALELFLSGDWKVIDQFYKQSQTSRQASGCDLPDFPTILPRLTDEGLNNHGLVNARISIQNTVYARPEWIVGHGDPMVRKMIAAWLTQASKRSKWAQKLYRGGMEFEATGLTVFQNGVNGGNSEVQHRSALDCVFDRLMEDPSDWRHIFTRTRIPLDDAWETYGHLFKDYGEFENYLCEMPAPIQSSRAQDQIGGGRSDSAKKAARYLIKWEFWSDKFMCGFLGSVMNQAKSCPIRLNPENFNWEKIGDGLAGVNPFGQMEFAYWIDSWCPGIRMPMGKAETTVRIASMLNTVEKAMMRYVRRGVPLILADTQRLDPEQIEAIKAARNLDALLDIINVENASDMEKVIKRIPAEQVPETLWNVRNLLKEELSTATGVAEILRGVPLGGERRTRYEVEEYTKSIGVQPRHLAMTYAHTLEAIAASQMRIASIYQIQPEQLNIDGQLLSTEVFPIKQALSLEVDVEVKESSLSYKPEEEIKMEALMDFKEIDLPGIGFGVVDPYRAIMELNTKIGRDPTKTMYPMQEYLALQASKALAATNEQAASGKTNGSTSPSN